MNASRCSRLFGRFRDLLADRRGAIAILTAFVFIAILGFSALAVEFGRGLLRRVQDQRVADIAAYSGALVYNATGSASATNSAVAHIVQLNGLTVSAANTTIVASPSGDGNQAVQVTVTTSDPLILARVLYARASLPVSAMADAEMNAGAPACIIALDGAGTGITLSGGTALSAPGCAVASNNTVTVPCGDKITTKVLAYDSAAPPSEPCSGIEPPSGTSSVRIIKQATADPLKDNPGVIAAYSHLDTVDNLVAPSGPSVPPGGDIVFGYNQAATEGQVAADGCSAALSGNVWTVTCSGDGPFDFGNISLAGGITVNFSTSGSPTATYNFSGQVYDSGAALNFGSGTFNIVGGVLTGGGSSTTFGAGTFNIGNPGNDCGGVGEYSICNEGQSLTFGGPSTFVIADGIYNKGGSVLTLGSGSNNSFNIGDGGGGNSLYMGGGAVTTFADATGSGDLFQMSGNVNVASGGGSCLMLGAAAQHDIGGYFSTAGGTMLGAGVYSVWKYVALGNNGGGDASCRGADVGMNGSGVTFAIDGASVPSSGVCAGSAFCLAAGYSHVDLTAPSSGSTASLLVIGPKPSANTGGAVFTEGASHTSLSGAFYVPHGPINLSGGASVGNGAGQCLELIGTQVSLAGGSALGTTCAGLGGGSIGQGVALVQ